MWIINQKHFKAYNKEKGIELKVDFKIEATKKVYCYLIINFIHFEAEIKFIKDKFDSYDFEMLTRYTRYSDENEIQQAYDRLCNMKKFIDFVENVLLKTEYLYLDKIEEMYKEFEGDKNESM